MRSLLMSMVIALLSIPAFSQPATHVRAEVPFAFEMAGLTMPAGQYMIPNPGNSGLQVQNSKGKPAAFAMTIQLQPVKQPFANVELVFNKYGDRYFLSRVSHISMVYEVLKSKQERELVTSRMLAGLRPETVKISASIAR